MRFRVYTYPHEPHAEYASLEDMPADLRDVALLLLAARDMNDEATIPQVGRIYRSMLIEDALVIEDHRVKS